MPKSGIGLIRSSQRGSPTFEKPNSALGLIAHFRKVSVLSSYSEYVQKSDDFDQRPTPKVQKRTKHRREEVQKSMTYAIDLKYCVESKIELNRPVLSSWESRIINRERIFYLQVLINSLLGFECFPKKMHH